MRGGDMLEDVIKTEIVGDRTVSILLYSIDKDDRDEDKRTHYYEIRTSYVDETKLDFEIYSIVYIKREAMKELNEACKYIEHEQILNANIEKKYKEKAKVKLEVIDEMLRHLQRERKKYINL